MTDRVSAAVEGDLIAAFKGEVSDEADVPDAIAEADGFCWRLWELFLLLRSRVAPGFSGVNPLPLSELVAWAKTEPWLTPSRQRLIIEADQRLTRALTRKQES